MTTAGIDPCNSRLIQRACDKFGIRFMAQMTDAVTHRISSSGRGHHGTATNVTIDWIIELARANWHDGAPLAGCVIAISKKMQHRRMELKKLIEDLGGDVQPAFDATTATHYIHSSTKQNETFAEFKEARRAHVPICHPAWIEASADAGRQASTQHYLHTYQPGKALGFAPSSAAPLRAGSAPPGRSSSVAPTNPALDRSRSAAIAADSDDDLPPPLKLPVQRQKSVDPPRRKSSPVVQSSAAVRTSSTEAGASGVVLQDQPRPAKHKNVEALKTSSSDIADISTGSDHGLNLSNEQVSALIDSINAPVDTSENANRFGRRPFPKVRSFATVH